MTCQQRFNEMEEINGKADILRWEILYEYGGFFLDADSICIEPFDENILNVPCFAGWEHEQARPGLIATGTMGFPPKHPLVKRAIDWIQQNEVSNRATGKRAWLTVGPMLLTNMYNVAGAVKDLTIFPSYYFLPIHCTGLEYTGHGKVYAYQAWGSTKQNYDIMNNIQLPPQFQAPPKEKSVSVLISSYNTKAGYIQECINSIQAQQGYFHMEIVWLNDGSDQLHTSLLQRCLNRLTSTSRFLNVVYVENEGNNGLGYTLNKGVNLCSNEIIIKMDSDDIMLPQRIQTQTEYMRLHPECMIMGTQLQMFKVDPLTNAKVSHGNTNHKSISWNDYKQNPSHWFINHPMVCYRKSAILKAGNYDINLKQMAEDFELELRMLKTHGSIHNLNEVLLYYRLHDEQVTYNGGKEGTSYWNGIRNAIIARLMV